MLLTPSFSLALSGCIFIMFLPADLPATALTALRSVCFGVCVGMITAYYSEINPWGVTILPMFGRAIVSMGEFLAALTTLGVALFVLMVSYWPAAWLGAVAVMIMGGMFCAKRHVSHRSESRGLKLMNGCVVCGVFFIWIYWHENLGAVCGATASALAYFVTASLVQKGREGAMVTMMRLIVLVGLIAFGSMAVYKRCHAEDGYPIASPESGNAIFRSAPNVCPELYLVPGHGAGRKCFMPAVYSEASCRVKV